MTRKLLKKTGNVHTNGILKRICEATIPAEKTVSNTYSECVFVVLVIQHAKRMRRIVSLSVACPTVQYSSKFPHQRLEFCKNVLNIKYAF